MQPPHLPVRSGVMPEYFVRYVRDVNNYLKWLEFQVGVSTKKVLPQESSCGVSAGSVSTSSISPGSAYQLLGTASGGTSTEWKTLAGTSNRVSVSHGAGSITLSGPQDLASGSSPTFAGLTLSAPLVFGSGGTGLSSLGTAGQVLKVDAGATALEYGSIGSIGAAPSDASYVALGTHSGLSSERVLTGTANQVVVTDNGAGSSVVLSLPQNVHTGASPTFAGLTLSSPLSTGSGGTGLGSWTQGDIAYYDSGSALSKLAKNTSSTRYLSNTGSSNNPAWAQVNVVNGVTGTLAVGNGGTGVTGLSDILGTSNQVAVSGGTGRVIGGNVTLSLPQSINIAASVQFAQVATGHSTVTTGVFSSSVFGVGDTFPRWLVQAQGALQWGSGTAGLDTNLYRAGTALLKTDHSLEVAGSFQHSGTNLGFFATSQTPKKTVTGSRGGNAALASVITQLAAYGLINDSSTV